MDGSITRLPKTNQDREMALLKEVHLRGEEWIRASEANREFARYRFMNAVNAFNRLVHFELGRTHVPKL